MAVTAIGDGAFLDLSLRYPNDNRRGNIPTIVFYLLAISMFVAIPILPFLPRGIIESVLGLAIGVAFAMSIAGGIVFIGKWFRASQTKRREQTLTPIVAVLILTSAVDLMADSGMLPGIPEAWSLVYTIDPVIFAWALTRRTKFS